MMNTWSHSATAKQDNLCEMQMQDDDRNDDEDDERASSFISTFIVHRSSFICSLSRGRLYRGGVFIEGGDDYFE